MVIRSSVDNILISTNGTNGQPGAPGTSSYIHIKYSNDGGATFTSNSGEAIGAYIGIYKDFTEEDSNNVSDYQWKKIEGEDGEPAYTVMLSNENFSISTDTSYVPIHTQSFTCNVTVLKGSSPASFTITASTDTENDIITTVNGHTVNITVAPVEALSATQGIITLTISTTEGHSFTKDITWSVAIQGRDGQPGSSGVSITGVTNYYLATLADSGVTKQTAGWTTTIQNITEHNPYLWNYEVVTGSNGATISSTDPVIIGRYGRDGDAAAEGRGIYSIAEHYQVSSSNTTPPTTWSDTPVTTDNTNKYLWNYETITYTDNTSVDTQKRVIGTHGTPGAPGTNGTSITISSTSVKYAISASSTQAPTDESEWGTTVKTTTAGKQYLWTRTIVTYSDNTSTTSYSVARQGIDGTNGTNGSPGKDGKDGTSTYVHIKYSAVASPTDSDLTENPSDYIGICHDSNVSDPTTASSYTWSKWQGHDGQNGQPGAKGEDGTNSYIHFAYSSSSDGSEDFSTTSFDGALYIGILVDDILEDSLDYEDYEWSLIKGEDGTSVTVTNTVYAYQLSTSGTTIPTGTWQTTPQAPTTTQYAWTRTTTTFSDGSTAVTYTVGGKVGQTGSNGNDGRGVVSITEYFLLSSTNDSTQIVFPEVNNKHGWTTVGEALIWSRNTPYLWHCTEVVYENPSSTVYIDKYCDTSWEAADLVQANLTDFQQGVDNIIDRDNQSIRSAVWENTYTYKPKKDSQGNYMYDDNGKIIPDVDTATKMSSYMAEQILNMEGITSRVASTESDVDGIDGRLSTAESTITQHATDIEAKVSKDGVIAAINLSTETEGGSTAKISADKVEINGTAIFNSISDDVNSAIEGKGYATTAQAQGYANTAQQNAIAEIPTDISELNNDAGYQTASDVSGAIVSTTTLYYASNSTTPPNKPTSHVTTNSTGTRGAWNISLPSYNASYPYLYICTEVKTKGDSYYWTSVEQTAYASAISSIKSTADAASPKSSAIARSQRIYYRKTTSGAPSKNTTWLATSGTGYGNWSLSVPQLTDSNGTKYLYLYTAVQTQTVAQQAAGTACTCSDVLIDDTATIIDGGTIITGTVTAREITADNLQGDHGWINLKDGKFYYGDDSTFAASDNAISWNGSKLQIKADEFLLASGKSIFDEIEAIETWFYATAPTTSNAPASSWTTDNLKEMHLRDIYFDTNSGKSYRWAKEGSTYKWVEIEDKELAAIAGRVSTAETNIQSNSEQITSRATKTEAQEYATTAENNAKADTTEKLKSYSTTTEMNSAIEQKANEITASVSTTYATKTYADDKASDAESSAETYADSAVATAKSEIKITTDGISTEVAKISSAKYINSSVAGWTLANVKSYATEGKSTTFNVESTDNLRVGDTVYIKGTDTTRNCLVYIKITVTAIPSTTKVTGTAHGYEDILPIDTIKSTINQSSDSVKIQAKHVEIDGSAIFTNSDFQTALNEKGYQTASDVNNIVDGKGYALNSALTTEINQRKAQYGTSSTGATTRDKSVTCANFELVAGNEITVKFSAANTYTNTSTHSSLRLKVGDTDAKDVWVANAVTGYSNQLLWGANAYITFRYDGTQFIVIGEPRTWYGASTTPAGTATKTDTTAVTGCVICKGAKVELAMTNNNTASAPKLNIQSTGAKNIYYGTGTNAPTVANGHSWIADTTATFTFDGQFWRMAGQTVINGDNITTGTISANRLNIGDIISQGTIAVKSDVPTSVADLSDHGDYLKTANLESAMSSVPVSALSGGGNLIGNVTTKTQYCLHTSNSPSSPPSESDWQDTVPTWSGDSNKKYIWTRVATTKTPVTGNAQTTYSTGVYDSALTSALIGLESKADSSDAVKEVTTTQQYYLHTSPSSAPGSNVDWLDTVPTWSTGKYIWTRSKIIKKTVSGGTSTSYAPTNGVYNSALTTALSTAAYAQDAVDNISIGENLLLDSDASSLTKVMAGSDRYWSSSASLASHGTAKFVEILDSPCRAKNGIELECTTTATVTHGLAFYNAPNTSKLSFTNGQTYTMSCYVKVVSGTVNQCQFNIQNGSSIGYSTYRFTPTSEWKRYSVTFTATSNLSQKVVYFEMAYTSIGAVQMCGFKLEKGNMATAWSDTMNVVEKTHRIYFRKSEVGTPTIPSSWVTDNTDIFNGWTTKVPRLTENVDGTGTKYLFLYTCEQYLMSNKELRHTDVLLDDSTTVIDGGNIITGSIATNKLDVNDINVNHSFTIGAFDADAQDSILNSNVEGQIVAVNDALDDFKETVGGDIDASAQELTDLMTELDSARQDDIEAANIRMDEQESSLAGVVEYQDMAKGWLTFNVDVGELTIGKSGSQFTTVISNSRLSFNDSGHEVAYISSQELVINDAKIKKTLGIGNYIFVPHENDNGMSLIWSVNNSGTAEDDIVDS